MYVIWGSTYLGMRVAIETMPPLTMLGTRFIVAGTGMLAWARWRDGELPSKRAWMASALSGTLMLACGNGSVVWAEQHLPSGIVAFVVAAVPCWMVLLEWLRPGGSRPTRAVLAGLAIGATGLALLVGEIAPVDGHGMAAASVLILLGGSLCFAIGSLHSRQSPHQGHGIAGAATQMLSGGVALLVMATARHEGAHFDVAHVSSRSLFALAYLVVFGSVIGFTAYLYMLRHATTAKASTYAYVNPVVALFLGWLIGGEPVTARTLGAAGVIAAGVVTITLAREAVASH
ncbi:MAG: EamA family transporter [Gemmatimonadaceae bacterium]